MVRLELVLRVKSEDVDRARNLLLNDDAVSRANVLFRDASIVGGQGYYIRIIGTDEQCKRALDLTREVAEEVTGEEREKVLSRLKEEGEAAAAGFGRLFG